MVPRAGKGGPGKNGRRPPRPTGPPRRITRGHGGVTPAGLPSGCSPMTSTPPIRIGILTVSDRASRGVYQDLGGPAIRDCLGEILSCPWEAVARVIPDERPLIEETLKELCDREGCCLVVTTGGTGPARRDVTPEATEAVCDKILDGFGEQMRAVSLKVVPTAILSRQIAG